MRGALRSAPPTEPPRGRIRQASPFALARFFFTAAHVRLRKKLRRAFVLCWLIFLNLFAVWLLGCMM